MAYGTGEFMADALATARSLHLSYRRSKFLLDRWYSGLNTQIDDPAVSNLMNRVAELIADYEETDNAKLNTVLAMSDLTLPK